MRLLASRHIMLNMNRRLGFTVVELTVVIVVMAILLTLGTLGLRTLQVDSRDKERDADVNTISMKIENTYTQTVGSKPAGSYPPVSGSYEAGFTVVNTTTDGVDADALNAPGQASVSLQAFPKNKCTAGSAGSVCNTGVLAVTDITKDKYIYQPIVGGGDLRLCTVGLSQPCRAYKMYYVSEVNNNIVTIESRRK